MAAEELGVVRLREDFYRDGFKKALIVLIMMTGIVIALFALSLFLWFAKPNTVYFASDNDWRIVPLVPIDQPYLNTPDLLQWVSNVLPMLFTFDFVNYDDQVKQLQHYFTPDGWNKFLDQLHNDLNTDLIEKNKSFINAKAGGAPYVLNQGVLSGRYAWWVQMPIIIDYSTWDKSNEQNIVVQVLLVRVPMIDNFHGISIDNMIITKSENQ